MPNVYDYAETFRARLLRNERTAAGEMVRRYIETWKRIKSEADTLLTQIEAMPPGERSVSALLRLDRLRSLNIQIREEVGSYGSWARRRIETQQAAAFDAGMRDADALMRAALRDANGGAFANDFNVLPSGAIARAVGALQDESPLLRLLDALGPRASAGVQSAIVNGVALGWGGRKTAAAIRAASGETLTRSLRIARTETLRAYREATRETYTANNDIVGQWAWRSARTTRTCAACWSMDGRKFDLDVPMMEHPNGRCMAVPIIDRARLGLPPSTSRLITNDGPDEFAKLSPNEQRSILGPTKHDAYIAGDLDLHDVAGIRRHPDWGETVRIKTLRELELAD